MDPSDERHIERFIRNPEALPAERRREIRHLIEVDPGARAYTKFLRGFYEQLEEEPPTFSEERVEAFVEELFEGKESFEGTSEDTVVSLRPFRKRSEAGPTVFAAETDAPESERRFSVLTTLAAETEDVLVRIVEDRDAGKGRLYVLDEFSERQAHVVVSFPGLRLDLVADGEGHLAFDLPADVGVDQWAEARAVVRRPVSAQPVLPDETETISLRSGKVVRARRKGELLTVALESSGAGPLTFATAKSPSGPARLLRFDASAERGCDVSPEASVTVRVYE